MTNNGFQQKSKNTTTTKHKIKHENPCLNWESNPGPLAAQLNVLPVNHRVH